MCQNLMLLLIHTQVHFILTMLPIGCILYNTEAHHQRFHLRYFLIFVCNMLIFYLFVLLMICPVCPVYPAASYGAYPICKGCSVCSRDNGCVNCQPKLFLFLRRERMRQYGECLHDCPAGYYGVRSPELNMCSRKSSPHIASPPLHLSHTAMPFTSTHMRSQTSRDLLTIIQRRHTYLPN